jgi:O-antigen ligase
MSEINRRLLIAAQFSGMATLFFLPISVALVNVFAGLFAACVFLNRDFWRECVSLWRLRAVKAAMILLGALFISVSYSSAPTATAFDFATKYRKLLFIPLLIWAFQDSTLQRKAASTLLVSLTIVLLLSYTNYFGWTDTFHPRGYAGIGDTALVFHQRITQGIFMALLFCLAVTQSRNESVRPLKWALCLIALLAAFDAMFLVNSRTGQLCLLTAALWMLLNKGIREWPKNRMRSSAIVVGGLALLFGFFVLAAQQKSSRLTMVATEIQEGSETSSGIRLESYALSWKLIKANPWFGTGTGSVSIESDRMRLLHETTLSHAVSHPHDEYLLMMIQLGVPGLVLFLWLLHSAYTGAKKLTPQDRDILQSYVVIFAVACLPNPSLLDFNEGHMFVFISGIFLAPLLLKKPQSLRVKSP